MSRGQPHHCSKWAQPWWCVMGYPCVSESGPYRQWSALPTPLATTDHFLENILHSSETWNTSLCLSSVCVTCFAKCQVWDRAAVLSQQALHAHATSCRLCKSWNTHPKADAMNMLLWQVVGQPSHFGMYPEQKKKTTHNAPMKTFLRATGTPHGLRTKCCVVLTFRNKSF